MTDGTTKATPDFGFRTCAGTAWAIVRDHWFPLVSAAFLREWLSLVVGGLTFALFIDLPGWNLLIALVTRCIAWSALQSGYMKFCLNACQNNKVAWKDLSSSTGFTFHMLLATLCLWASVALGLVLLIVPGLYLAIRFSLYGFALVDQKLDAIKSLQSSHRMLKGFGKCATALFVFYWAAVWIFAFFLSGFETMFVVSLCTLYLHIRTQEANS